MDVALEQFVSQTRAWKDYFSARVRVALAVLDDGQWDLWYSYTAFLPEVPDSVEILNVHTDSVRAVRDIVILNNKEVEAEIAELQEAPGYLKTEEWSARIGLSPHLHFAYESLHPDRFSGPRRLPALTVSLFNTNYRPFSPMQLKKIDQELQLHEQPFDGIADLAQTLNLPVSFDELNKQRFSEYVLVSPVDLLFDLKTEPHSDLKNGELSLVLKGHPALPPNKLRLGVRAFRQKTPPERFTISDGQLRSDPDGLMRCSVKLATADVPFVQVFVSSDGSLLGKWFVKDFGNSFNDRMLLHRALDIRDDFKASFFERPEQFEDRVLLLLTLFGLTALKYGRIQTDAPDILAISTGRHVYVVECTTGDINSRGKLQRLSDRSKQIRDRLSATTNPPVGVVPVVFTSLLREQTAMHWDTAATFGIALVTRDNIRSLLENLDAEFPADQLYTSTLALIPSKKISPPTEDVSGIATDSAKS
jgi:hypothetical protein